jgi:hypothetical protein
LIFNENFILGSCHPAVVSFLCKKWETSKKIFLDRARLPWQGLKKAHRHIREVKKFFFKPPHDGYQKTQNFV